MSRLFLLVVCALLPLSAQSVVEGVVVESVAKSPVVGATVQIMWLKPLQGDALIHGLNDNGPKATTDETGRFHVEIPTPSEFTFIVTKEGFSSLEGKAAGSFALKERESKREITLTLQQECMIEGRVWDPDLEKPVAGLLVQAYGQFSPRPGNDLFVPRKKATTDQDGRYKLEGLRAGKFIVAIGPSAQGIVHEAGKAARQQAIYRQVYYPGVEEQAAAAQIDLLPGARAGSIDLRVRKSDAFRVRGKVQRADGKPIASNLIFGLSAKIALGGRLHRALGNLQDATAFDFEPVEPGTFELLCVTSSETRKDRLIGTATVIVEDKDVDDLMLVLKPGIRVDGSVQTENVEPGQLDPLWSAADKSIQVGLNRVTGYMYSDEWPVAVERESGRWSIEGIHDELHSVRVSGLPAGYAVTAMEYNGLAMPFGYFQPNLGAMTHNIRISVAPVLNAIRGVVTSDDKPVENALVLMVREPAPEDRFTWQSKAKLTSRNGEYVLETLEPGWYRIAATAPHEDREAIFNRIVSGDCQRIEITKTSNTTLNLIID